MSVLSKYCNRELVTQSPPIDTYDLVSDFSSGVEVRSFVKVDYPKVIESHGSVSDWSLESLMKAGINPNFGIHTATSSSRIDEASASVESLNFVVDNILNSNKSE